MEIAGVALAVIPTIDITLKAYRSTVETFKAIKNHSKDVATLLMKVSVEKVIFETQCLLLLRHLNHLDNPDWVSSSEEMLQIYMRKQDMQRRIDVLLADNKENFLELGQRTKEILQKIEVDMKRIKTEVGSSSLQSLRNLIRLLLKKRGISERLEELHQQNENLQIIVSNICALDTPVEIRKGGLRVPGCFSSIKTAAHDLFDSLLKSWSCKNNFHESHEARLGVDTTVKENGHVIEFGLSVASNDNGRHNGKRSQDIAERSDSLYAQSSWPESVFNYVPLSGQEFYGMAKWKTCDSTESGQSICNQQDKEESLCTKLEKSLSTLPDRPDSFQISQTWVSLDSLTPPSQNRSDCETLNAGSRELQQLVDLCSFFENSLDPNISFIFFVTPSNLKQVFTAKDMNASTMKKEAALGKETSLSQLLDPNNAYTIPVDVKLMLAEGLTKAVLQYHSTPWMHQQWSISDIGLFGVNDGLTKDSIRTLHLKKQIQNARCGSAGAISAAATVDSATLEDEAKYGVYNPTLFRLGVAFLELEFGRRLHELHEVIGENTINTARRLARSTRVILSEKYRQLIDRCLRCDFGGVGTDLTKPALQEAVYWKIACELEKMYRPLLAP